MTADEAPRPDTHDMVLVHQVFRRELGLLPGLIRAVSDGDTARSEQLGAHAAVMLEFLAVHHAGEDELLWPKLLERVPSAPVTVERMERAHGEVHDRLVRVEDILPVWRASAAATDGEELAEAIVALSARLNDHLIDEEYAVLPLVIGNISVDEWAELGAHGLAHVAPQDRLAVLGGILEETDDAERATFLGHIDPVATQLWNGGGAEAYATYVAVIRGTG